MVWDPPTTHHPETFGRVIRIVGANNSYHSYRNEIHVFKIVIIYFYSINMLTYMKRNKLYEISK